MRITYDVVWADYNIGSYRTLVEAQAKAREFRDQKYEGRIKIVKTTTEVVYNN